jgi:hypothetical protein
VRLSGRGTRAKKSAAFAAALNPPKEEGGGDKPWSAGLLADAHYDLNYPEGRCAMQENFCAAPQMKFIQRPTEVLGNRTKSSLIQLLDPVLAQHSPLLQGADRPA